jgi:hypothetical protein
LRTQLRVPLARLSQAAPGAKTLAQTSFICFFESECRGRAGHQQSRGQERYSHSILPIINDGCRRASGQRLAAAPRAP